jgi:hypothetical protein
LARRVHENASLLEADSKLELLRRHVIHLQESRQAVSMRVRRAHLVEDVVSVFKQMDKDTALHPLNVSATAH